MNELNTVLALSRMRKKDQARYNKTLKDIELVMNDLTAIQLRASQKALDSNSGVAKLEKVLFEMNKAKIVGTTKSDKELYMEAVKDYETELEKENKKDENNNIKQ